MGNSVRKHELKTLKDLKDTGFGRPAPRHGLKLLFWFVKDAIGFEEGDAMVVLCDPKEGDYGFHHFGNFEKILPELQKNSEEKYFEVGNLEVDSHSGARDLPDYVRQDYDYTRRGPGHNKDRIIVRLKSRNVVMEIYITEHVAWSNGFDPNCTYLLTPHVVRLIKDPYLELEEFLYRTGYTSKLKYFFVKCLRCFQ